MIVSSLNQPEEDLELKSPSITVNNGLNLVQRIARKMFRKSSKSSLFCLGDLYITATFQL